jgi:hypothetical protein
MDTACISSEISLTAPIYSSAGKNPYPHYRSDLVGFIDSRMFLAYVVYDVCEGITAIPYLMISLWFNNTITNENNPPHKAAELDRYDDCVSFHLPTASASGREWFAEPLLSVHAQLRNIRRELHREFVLGPKNAASLLSLSRIVHDCIRYFAGILKTTGCAKALVEPYTRLRLLRRRLSLITTKTVDRILSVAAFEAEVLQPFCAVVSRFLDSPSLDRNAVEWHDELSVAVLTGERYVVEPAPTTLLTRATFTRPLAFDLKHLSDADKTVLKQVVHRFIAKTGAASIDDIVLRTPFPSDSIEWAMGRLVDDGKIRQSDNYFVITTRGIKELHQRPLLQRLFRY